MDEPTLSTVTRKNSAPLTAVISIVMYYIVASFRVDLIDSSSIGQLLPGIKYSGVITQALKIAINIIFSILVGIQIVRILYALRRLLYAPRNTDVSKLRESVSLRRKYDPPPAQNLSVLPDKVRLTYVNIQNRIDDLAGRATLIYWTMVVMLVTGVILIIFAGKLASLDSTLGNLRSQVDSASNSVMTSIENDKNVGRRIFEFQIDALQRSRSDLGDGKNILENQIRTPSNTETDPVLAKRLDALTAEQATVDHAIIAGTRNNSEKSPSWNWPSTVLRIGVIGLLVFMVQILISLYRYNSRLLVFYVSRRDCLSMSSDDEGKHKEYVDLFYPQHLDFGHEPRHPFVEAAELFRKTASGARRTNKPKASSDGAADPPPKTDVTSKA